MGLTLGMDIGFGRGQILGPELSAPFVPAGTGWTVTGADGTHIVTFGTDSCRYQSDTISPVLSVSRGAILTVGRTYRITAVCSAFVSGVLKTDALGSVNLANALGTTTFDAVATAGIFTFLRNSTNVDLTLSSISIREVM